jgi:hypothetical protein
MNQIQTLVWQSLAWPSNVIHQHMTAAQAHYGHGFVAGRSDEGLPLAIEYEIALTAEWEVSQVRIKSLVDGREISLICEDKKWYDGQGNHLIEFDGIPFIDLSISPFTNTLPIKRLRFDGDKPQQIETLYFDENRFLIRKVQQLYSKLNEKTYRYQDVEQPDFVVDLVVDNDGWVIEYPQLFKRV